MSRVRSKGKSESVDDELDERLVELVVERLAERLDRIDVALAKLEPAIAKLERLEQLGGQILAAVTPVTDKLEGVMGQLREWAPVIGSMGQKMVTPLAPSEITAILAVNPRASFRVVSAPTSRSSVRLAVGDTVSPRSHCIEQLVASGTKLVAA